MDNQEFLKAISDSFKTFLDTGSRSNAKLKVLHGAIAKDLTQRLGKSYSIQSLGIGNNKEWEICGRYIDKKVDITIVKDKDIVAGIGVKFVMQNYSQNSNNYFENMLGETANIRCSRKPYFQVFIIPEKLPYYEKDGTFKKWETFSEHNAWKYLRLSEDNIETSVHTPTKTLLYVIHLPEMLSNPLNRNEYANHYRALPSIAVKNSSFSYGHFGSAVVYNDYANFANKVAHYIMSI